MYRKAEEPGAHGHGREFLMNLRFVEAFYWDGEYLKELAAKGMKIVAASEGLKKGLSVISERMTADGVKLARDDGKIVIDTFNKK